MTDISHAAPSSPATPATRLPRGLYGITPEWDDTDRLLAAIRAAARGGLRTLQLRRKTVSLPFKHQQAIAVRDVCRELGVVFILNDHWRLAQELGADGVHLGREDGDLALVRQSVGDSLLIGASCYDDIGRARELLDAGADYVAFGAVYPSPTKPQAVRAPLSLLGEARSLTDALPAPRPAVVAIGGITPDNAAAVAEAGADALALISGLFEAPDVEAAARACTALYTRA
ncbi:Thiamin-phosphate pyrophosphorylase [plant metagenome]|uniref:thiamine phosphate synthase n=1 Tax=plant metagenome TaxID=1297885 RepID=A0A484V4C3_9ZZZZ